MTTFAILPTDGDNSAAGYEAVSRKLTAHGATAGAALDALSAQLTEDENPAFVVVQAMEPDRFFGKNQHEELARRMAEWRRIRDLGEGVEVPEALERLVEDELRAATARAQELATNGQ